MLTLDMLVRGLEAGGIAVALGFLWLVLLRWRVEERGREVESAVRTLEPILHSWLVLNTDISVIKKTLRGFRPFAAFRGLARLATQQVTFERQQALAQELRGEKWVGQIVNQANSPFWWKRFDAARLLSVVGTEDDAETIAALLLDSNAAVRLVAMDAAARLNGVPLVARELDTLPTRQDAVQAYHLAAMSRQPGIFAAALIPRLNAETPPASLNSWIDAAGAFADPDALKKVRELAGHPSGEVRTRVARALRRLSDPDTPPVLMRLLADDDWRVRAQAARALGALRCGEATDQLATAVRDKSWWVRYRSALALAQIAGPARAVLLELRESDDAMTRDMAKLVAGLTSAAVVEMSEV